MADGDVESQDLLPLLPDFTEIDLFKEQICNSLNSYGSRIQEVKAEMLELTSTVESSLQVGILYCGCDLLILIIYIYGIPIRNCMV